VCVYVCVLCISVHVVCLIFEISLFGMGVCACVWVRVVVSCVCGVSDFGE